jgi:hypothetical protein
MEDTNIKSTEDLKEMLKDHPNFDWEEFDKPFSQIDFGKLAKSVDLLKISGIWINKQSKN